MNTGFSMAARRLTPCLAVLGILIFALPITGQQADKNAEISSKESTPQYRIQVERNLVQVRVVVRDAQGQVVPTLTKDDFQLTDEGKPQVISHFEVVDPRARAAQAAPPPTDPDLAEEDLPVELPDRYIAFFFDDIHIQFPDLQRTREAAERYLTNTLRGGDRVGIFTSSGTNQLDYTDDLGKMHEAMRLIHPHPITPRRTNRCPEVDDYQAYMIIYRHDPFALEIAMEEAMTCDPSVMAMAAVSSAQDVELAARASAEQNAREALNQFQTESEYVLRGLEGIVRQMGGLPGQRTLVLVSPGFLMVTAEMRVSEIIDRALRANVVVNALDAKGLGAPVLLGDASKNPVIPISNARMVGNKARFQMDEFNNLSEVMREMTNDTGGVFFTNNNDLDLGFRKVGALPELYYVLAFSPQNMKFNGNFHKIKVKLTNKAKLQIQARKGYFAPEKPVDPAAQEKEEIAQAIFSQSEVRELPVDVQTQFFKITDTEARLAVLTHLDLGMVQFRKENGRNLNNITLVTVIFDRNGKYVDGNEKKMEFRLLDPTFERLSVKGITSKASFKVIPGSYVIRLVVRDSEGAQLSALNKRVDIPL